MVAFGLIATAPADDAPDRHPQAPGGPDTHPSRRPVYYESWQNTPAHRIETLRPGTRIDGPAVIDGPATTVVIHPGQRVNVDETGALYLSWSIS